MNNWRYIPYRLSDAATNMAADEAILDAVAAGESPPTLRIYGFDPPAISIGHNQRLSSDQIQRVHAFGFEIARRPTGGRAVLHLSDLTYSFVGTTAFLSGSVIKAYKQICSALILALSSLGVSVEIGSPSAAYRDFQDCFLATSGSDLHYQGLKVVGSAQLRRHQGVLQHGSILLHQDQKIMSCLLNGSADDFDKRHANLNEILARDVSIGELSDAVKRGFEDCFAVNLIEGALSERELAFVGKQSRRYKIQMSDGNLAAPMI